LAKKSIPGLFITALIGAAVGASLTFLSIQPETPQRPEAKNSALPVPSAAEPMAFQVESCQTEITYSLAGLAPCLLVQAGGKRLIFGTPIFANWRGIGPLDAVFLFDGHPVSSGGHTSLRYETWLDGRRAPQLLVGGELSLETLSSLDDALLLSDALIETEEPQLDSRMAGFAVKPVPSMRREVLVFNTGDLQVFASSTLTPTGDQSLAYRVVYDGRKLDLYTCHSSNLVFDGPADASFLPVMNQSALTRLRERAVQSRLQARLGEITKVARTCPTLREAQQLLEAQGGVLLTVGDELVRPEGTESQKPTAVSIAESPYQILADDMAENP
tara:strand:- start:30491 stop:31480 length:990 start_codon:yes stop_codon:yes gene_type:complete